MDPFILVDKSVKHRGPLYLVVSIMVVFFLWAGFTQIDQHVRAMGRIVPSGKVRTVQHLEGGIVNDIFVQEGQQVEPGQPLFTIVNRRAEADLQEGQIQLDYLLIKQTRLSAERQGVEEPVFENKLKNKYPDIVASEMNLFNSRQQEFKQKIDGLQEKINQKSLRLDELRNTTKNLRDEAQVSQRQLQIKKKLYQSGAISQSQFLDAQSTVQGFVTRIQKNETEIPIVQAELAEAQNAMAESNENHASELSQQLNDANVDIKKQRERLSGSKDQVQRTSIVSPVKGIVNRVTVNTIGGIIKPGDVLAEILPLDEALLVEGKIEVNDRGKVWLGVPVVAKIMAYEYSVYGGLKGKLTYISADSFSDQRDNEFYQIKVTLDSNNLGKDRVLYPGMMVQLDIKTDKISVLRAIFKPLLRMWDTALRDP